MKEFDRWRRATDDGSDRVWTQLVELGVGRWKNVSMDLGIKEQVSGRRHRGGKGAQYVINVDR